MSTQPALFGELLPTLPGCTRGVVGERVDERGKKRTLLQCEGCYAIEETEILVLMKFKFHTRHKGDNPRLCPSCRVERYAKTCGCERCREDERYLARTK